MKRLVLDPSDDVTVSYVQDSEQPDHQQRDRRLDRRPDPARHAVLLRVVLAALRQPHQHVPVHQRHRDRRDPAQADLHAGVRQGDLPRRPRHVLGLAAVHADDLRRARCRPTTARRRDVITSSFAANSVNLDRGFKSQQINTTGNVDIALTSASFFSVRGGYFHDNYKDTGIPNTTNYIYQTSSVGLAGIPASVQGPIGTQNTPRALIVENDTTKRGFFNADYNHAFNAGGSAHPQGRLRLPEDDQRRQPGLPGGYVNIFWDRAFTFRRLDRGARHLRLLRGERPRRAGRGRRRHPLALRPGPVDGRQPADAEPRPAHRERERAVVPRGRPGASSSASATRSRRASARATTCAATAGSRSTAAGAGTTTGPSTSCRAARTAATPGRSTTAASTRSTSAA